MGGQVAADKGFSGAVVVGWEVGVRGEVAEGRKGVGGRSISVPRRQLRNTSKI